MRLQLRDLQPQPLHLRVFEAHRDDPLRQRLQQVDVPRVHDVQDALPQPTSVFFEVLPGAEVSASPMINLFARGLVSVPTSGSVSAYENEGDGLEAPPQPSTGVSRTGVAVQAGLTVRVGPFWRIDDSMSTTSPDDDLL